MPSYNWAEYRGKRWVDRYADDWALGVAEWRLQEAGPRWASPDIAALRGRPAAAKPPGLRVFVSHRQADAQYGLRIAWLADQEGFDFWLDVLDPDLAMLQALIGTGSLPPDQSALAVASVVEMALLNSTHVLAVMTPRTSGSAWVPYEYGRAKDPTVATLQAACWVGDGLSTASLPEYLYLGPVTLDELDIRSWFRAERARHGGPPSGNTWTGPPPAPLPR